MPTKKYKLVDKKVSDLIPYVNNSRTHDEEQVIQICSSIKEFGFTNSAHKYIAEIDGEPVGWCSILHFPHPSNPKLKRLHRTVVLPDYQGLGLGFQLRCYVCDRYQKQGFKINTVTTSPPLIHAMNKSPKWKMTRKPGRVSKPATSILSKHSYERLTASFQYVGEKDEGS